MNDEDYPKLRSREPYQGNHVRYNKPVQIARGTMHPELREIGKEVIGELCQNQATRWVVDANVVIGGEASKCLNDHGDVWTTSQVESEIRRRPKCINANEFADKIVENDRIWNLETSLTESELKGFEFLNTCAKELSPTVRVIKKMMIESGKPDSAQTEILAIEQAANDGWFFECELVQEMVDAGLMTPEEGEIDKATRRSWFKYPRKRREKQMEGEYLFSDEILIASAITDSILNELGLCILSNDNDLVAIMKQTSDNWLWAASYLDVEISNGTATLQPVSALWESRCQNLNRFRQQRKFQRFKVLFEALENGEVNSLGDYFVPEKNEVLICRPSDGGLSSFCFSEPMVRFVQEYDWLKRRADLIQKGFWLPK